MSNSPPGKSWPIQRGGIGAGIRHMLRARTNVDPSRRRKNSGPVLKRGVKISDRMASTSAGLSPARTGWVPRARLQKSPGVQPDRR
jgi:hypothetical protein